MTHHVILGAGLKHVRMKNHPMATLQEGLRYGDGSPFIQHDAEFWLSFVKRLLCN